MRKLSQVRYYPSGMICSKSLSILSLFEHVDDKNPGDRASECHGKMQPIGIDYRKNKGYMIEHRCMKCKKIMLNKVAPDDNFLDFIKQLNKERI